MFLVSRLIFWYVLLCASAFSQDTAAIRNDLTTGQLIINNALEFIVQNFPSDRHSSSLSSFSLFESRMNPIDSVLYGYVDSSPSCDTSVSYTTQDATTMHPCLVSNYASQYAVQVKFRTLFTSGNPLPSQVAKKYLLFLAYSIDGRPVTKVDDGKLTGVNSKIAYFLCYNPIVVHAFKNTDVIEDGVNNGIRAGGNVTSPGAVLSLNTPDSRYGGVASCLSNESDT